MKLNTGSDTPSVSGGQGRGVLRKEATVTLRQARGNQQAFDFNPPLDWDGGKLAILLKARGLKDSELADSVGVSKGAVSHWISDRHRPSGRSFDLLLRRLQVDEQFFVRSDLDVVDSAAAGSFYARPYPTREVRDRAEGFIQLLSLVARNLNPGVDTIPKFPATKTMSTAGAERLADRVRDSWTLPPGPIDDVVACLESHGVLVIRTRLSTMTIGAFSMTLPSARFVVLNEQLEAAQARVDASHELGHLVMHSGERFGQQRWWETQANAFGLAFLMPRSEVLPMLRRFRRPLREAAFMSVASRWKVPPEAACHRAAQLGMITGGQFAHWQQHFQGAGRKRAGAVMRSFRIDERPRLLSGRVQAFLASGGTLEHLSFLTGLSRKEVVRLLRSALGNDQKLIGR